MELKGLDRREDFDRLRQKRGRLTSWEAVLATAAVGAAVVAVWSTLTADFLAYPGWLAVQKADMILGPVLGGLYWARVRPQSRFGPVMVAVGFLSVPYVLHSFSAPWAFGIGVVWEGPVFLATLALILAFPSGRLHGRAERLILFGGLLGVVVPIGVVSTLLPGVAAGATISSCIDACPANALLIVSDPELAVRMIDGLRVVIVVLDLATMAVIAWRFATGSPPRRRALAIGTPIALLFLATQIAHQVARLVELGPGPVDDVVRWAYVVARASIWYGFLAALVVAELFAARVLRRVVEASLRRPSLRDLESMLRAPLGDPRLRLAYWSPAANGWVDGDRGPAQPGAGRVLTAIERDGEPAVAVIHDAQLAEDPELVHAAGVVALLARENAELESGWADSLRQLRDSRARIAAAGDVERRAIERDLHDGAQQQLTAVLLKLALVSEALPEGSLAQERLAGVEDELESTLQELRRLAHGIYPAPLAEVGIIGALEAVARRSGRAIAVDGEPIGRFAPEVESAVYFCCLEALQNATKHSGPGARTTVRFHESGTELHFEVRDDGRGFDPAAPRDGVGLRNMRDRLEALHGRLEITSAPGQGTVISGSVPAG